jgi:hypothetical protein
MESLGAFGHVNDSIRRLATDGPANETWEFFCECPDVECHAFVDLTLLEFDRRRAAVPPEPVLAPHDDDHRPAGRRSRETPAAGRLAGQA